MKIKNYFLSLAAVALVAGFASCSNDDIVPGTDPVVPEPEKQIGQDGVAYLKLGINLGQDASGRANDSFDDGDAYEYAVENATLVIFAGAADADEDEMTMRSAYDLAEGAWNNNNTEEQITTERVITTKVLTQNIQAGERAFAYVILNRHNFFKVGKENASDEHDMILQANGQPLDQAQKKFGGFRKILLDEQDKNFSNQSFTMTNMPHVHKPGGVANMPDAVKPWVLMEINRDKVYPTLAKANASSEPSVEIDVERVVAKIEMNVSSDYTKDGETGYYKGVMQAYDAQSNLVNTNPAINLAIIGWFIDNTNKYAYLSRNSEDPVGQGFGYLKYRASDLLPYRMVAKTPVHLEAMGGNYAFRTYWGIDPNYNTGDVSGLTTEAGNVVNNELMKFNDLGHNIGGRLRAPGSHYYCAENTFDVVHQTVENTTRVIVAVKFNDGDGFYTLTSQPNEILKKDSLESKIKYAVLGRVNVDNWIDNVVMKHLKEDCGGKLTGPQQVALLEATVTNGVVAGASPVQYTGKASVAIGLSATGLAAVVKENSISTVTEAWNLMQTDQENYVARFNEQLSYYHQGVAYYQALIRHFDDTETPWTPFTTMTNVTESIYDNNNEARYLGRYGVLRNNWYNLTIDAITHIGSSTIPDCTKEPDDTVEQYLKVKINVMPWVKRTQNVIL